MNAVSNRTPAARKSRALAIAKKRGGTRTQVVEKMDFREPNENEKNIAKALIPAARRALQKHGGKTS